MKKILLLFYCLCTIYGLQAQTPITNWEYAIGDNGGVEQIKTSAYDEAGNLYVAGHFYGTVDLDHGSGAYLLTASGSYDAFVAKYNSFGEILWAMRMGGTLSESVNHLSVANGYVLLTGFFQGTMTVFAPNITFPLTSVSSSADIFMARLGTDGLFYNAYKIGMGGNDDGKCIKSDAAGNIYLAGYYSSPGNNTNVNFNLGGGTNNLLAAGGEDGFIVKYNSSFALQWVKKYGGSSFNDAVLAMDIDNNQNVYAAGFFNGTNATFNDNIFLTSVGGADAFISKIAANGNTLWAKRIGGGNGDVISTIKLNGKGVIYAGGNFNGLANLNPNGTAQNFTAVGGDAFISKLDTNQATALWIKQFGGSGLDNLNGLDLDTLGNVYTTGSFIGSAEFPIGISASSLNSGSWKDIFVSKLNTNGVFVWSKSLGTVLEDDGYSISVTANGNSAYVTGSSPTFGNGYMAKIGVCGELKPITGLIKLCSNTQRVYSVDSVIGATSYVWTLPAGWIGTSNTRSITVTPSANSGNITVNANTACGAGFSRSLSINYGTTNLDNNLVRYWLANENDNNKDIKNNFGLTLVNTVKDTAMYGTVNGAYRITNNAGFIQLQPTANLPTGATSISLWYYYQSNGGNNNVILGSNGTALPASHPILLTDNASSKLYPWSSSGAPIGSGVSLAQNTWHHIVLTRNGSNFTFYVNGVLAYSGNNLSTSNFDRIGNNRPGVETQGATGKFDDIKIYNAIITEAQVKSLYEFGSIKSTSLLASGCKNKNISFLALSSNSNATYAWKLNGTTVGSSLPTFVKTPSFTDSVISVTVNSQCFEENISKSFKINSADSVRIISTDCGIKVGNKTYSTTGNYIDTLINQYGCDSIVYLNLTVSNSQFTNLNTNLIRYWTLNAQDSAKDLTGNFVLNKTAGIVYSNDRFGNPNSALFIPAANAQEIAPAITLPTNNMTISFWYHYATAGITGVGVRGLLTNTSSFQDAGYYLYVDANGNLMVNNNAGVGTTVPGQLIVNNWYHLTFSLSNTSVAKVYVNGELKLSNNNMSSVGIVKIGRGPGNTYTPGVGSYDDIKVYNTVLSNADIAKIYDRPSIISRPFLTNFCQNNTANFAYKVSDSNNSTYQFLKNNTNVSNDTFYVANNIAATDTSITFKVFSKCGFEEFKTRINVQPTSIVVTDSFCGSYVYNNKTYTNPGTYYDTIANLNGCVVNVQLNLTFKAGLDLSSNLIRYWTLNAQDSTKDLTNNFVLNKTVGINYSNDRFGNPNSAIFISGSGQEMSPSVTLPASNMTISFWYQYASSSFTGGRGLLTNSLNSNAGYYLYVDANSNLIVNNNAGTGTTVPGQLIANNWYHLTFSLSNTGIAKVYVNGILKLTNNNMSLLGIIRIGRGVGTSNTPGVGSYDDIKVYNTVLSDADIAKIYDRPSIISRPFSTNFCQNNSANFTYKVSGSNNSSYQFLKNNTSVSNDTFYVANNLAETDTLVTFKVFSGCGIEEFKTRLNVQPTNVIVTDSFCANYIYNNKTYTNPGTYYDTMANLNGCAANVQLNLTFKAGVNLSSNLTHHFTLNNTENTNLVTSTAGITITATAPSVVGRANNAATGRAISAVGQSMILTGLPNSNITVSLWYQRTTNSYTGARTIIANSQANGNIAKMVYVNSVGVVFLGNTNTTAGVSTGFSVNTNVWYHMVYQVASNGDAKLYINGNLVTGITGLPLNTIELIGNRNDGNEPGIGNYDDVKVYNKILSADEISKLYNMPSLISRPTLIQVCEGSSALLTYHFKGNTGTRYEFKKNGITLSTDSFLLINNTNLNDTLYEFTVNNNCGYERYTAKVTVAPAGGGGQSLAYSKITNRITASSSFTRYKLFRNGVVIDSSNTTGNINFLTTLCGNYVAHYSNIGSTNCPSISPILKISLDTVTLNNKICAGKTYVFGSQQLNTPGTYYRTTTSVNGCDSIIKLNLTLANSSTASINRTGCGSLVIYGKTYTQTGQYKDTLINAAGCDSIVTLNLTINSGGPAINNIVQSTCNNFVLNGKTYTNTGIYRDTLFAASVTGCDSILVLNLTIQKNGSIQNISACKSYVFKGVTITQSGIYRDTLTNTAGCDSIVVYNINITTVNKIVTKTGNTLTASATNAIYQWINCTTNLPIANANTQSYTPTASGSYKVIITQNGCIDTSACTDVTIINCNLQLTHSVLNPTDTIRCKQVKVNITNGTLPIALKLTWSTNIIGISINITDSAYTFNNACPETYKLVATDNNGCKDSINFTINEPTIGVNDINENTFSMYPNPANKILIINNLSKESQINIFDITGRIIYAENILTSSTELDIENWKDGIYTVQIISEGKIANQKLVIAK